MSDSKNGILGSVQNNPTNETPQIFQQALMSFSNFDNAQMLCLSQREVEL